MSVDQRPVPDRCARSRGFPDPAGRCPSQPVPDCRPPIARVSAPDGGQTTTAPVVGSDWSDSALVTAVLLRREDAFAELYRRHVASVASASSRILGSGPDGDDVAAEVFAAFWLVPEAFDPARGSVLTFLRMKARGRSIDLVRSTVARRRREASDEMAGGTLQAVPTPDEIVVHSEAVHVMRRAVSRLPPGERDSISLAYFEGMSYKTVAVHLGIPEGTAKSRVRSGLRRLRANTGLGLQETWSQ
jgi:RNA polymerase sigma factor (sigma-70 family)